MLSIDLNAGHFPAQQTNPPTTTRYGVGYTPFQRSTMTSKGAGRTTGRSVNVVPENGYWVPVTTDAEYRFEMSSDKLGVLTPFRSALPAWTGQLVNKANAWRGLVSEQAAHALGLFRTGVDTVPSLATGAGTWSHPSWFKQSPLGVFPVSAPNGTDAGRAQFNQTLRNLRFTRNSLESIRTLLSERHGQALVEAGIPQQYRGRAPWRGFSDSLPFGGKNYRVTVQQVPGTRTVKDFGFGDVENGHSVATSNSASRGVNRSKGVSANITERITGPNGSTGGPLLNAGDSQGKSASESTSQSDTVSQTTVLPGPVATVSTSYDVVVTIVDNKGNTVLTHTWEAGSADSQEPLALLRPGGERAGDVYTVPPLSVDVLPSRNVTPENVGRLVTDHVTGAKRPEALVPGNGVHFTRVLGSENVEALAHITLAKAQTPHLNGGHAGKGPETHGVLTGDQLVQARAKAANAKLLAPGKGGGDTLTSGTNELSLTGSLIDGSALGENGYQPLGLVDDALIGGSTGSLQLHPSFDLSGAKLLATADVRMEYATGTSESHDVGEGDSDSKNRGLGGDAIGADSHKTTYRITPVIAPGVNSSEEYKFNEATAAKINMKPDTGRSSSSPYPRSGWPSPGCTATSRTARSARW